MPAKKAVNVIVDPAQATEAPPKPKRQLTEAQRLAFLKGREKRMANIERKRQEKLEAEKEFSVQVQEEPQPKPIPLQAVQGPVVIPDNEDEPYDPEMDEPHADGAGIIGDPPIPEAEAKPLPIHRLLPVKKDPTVAVASTDHTDEEKSASRIADFIFKRLTSNLSASQDLAADAIITSPPPKKKRAYVRKPKPVEEEDPDETEIKQTTVAPIPRKPVSWM